MNRSVEWVKRMMLQLHPYAFVPDLRPDREDERIREFLAQGPPAEDRSESRPRHAEVAEDDAASPLDI